jgi:hypothetical protein
VKINDFPKPYFRGGFGQAQGSANDKWDKITQDIRKVAKEKLGESRSFELRGKNPWW